MWQRLKWQDVVSLGTSFQSRSELRLTISGKYFKVYEYLCIIGNFTPAKEVDINVIKSKIVILCSKGLLANSYDPVD